MSKKKSGNRKRDQRAKTRQALILCGGFVFVAAALIAYTRLRGPRQSAFSYRDSVQIADDQLLLLATTHQGPSGHYDHAQLQVMDARGVVHHRITVDDELELGAVVDDLVWIDMRKQGVHARTLPDLVPVKATLGVVSGYPALAKRHTFKGTSGKSVVLQGADGFMYTVSPSGGVDKHAKSFDTEPSFRAMGGRAPDCVEPGTESLGLPRRLKQKFSAPTLAGCVHEGGRLELSGPRSILVESEVFGDGGTSWQLSRVTFDDLDQLWATPLSDLVAANSFDDDDGPISIEWIGMLGGKLRALIKNYSREARLVTIDPDSGKPVDVSDIRFAGGS